LREGKKGKRKSAPACAHWHRSGFTVVLRHFKLHNLRVYAIILPEKDIQNEKTEA